MKKLFGFTVMLIAAILTAGSAIAAEPSAPTFKLKDLAGKTVRVSSFRDKSPVLLAFWATWCPYCMKQIANLNQLEDAFGPDELAVLAVNSREGRGKVLEYVKQRGIRYRVLLDAKGLVTEKYGVSGFPFMVLIDTNGNIAATDYGVTTRLVDKIRSIIDSAPGSPASQAGAVQTAN
ncbi:MAG: TlpA family protein disulfide reductase [Candidatus Omnitrophica bacterium]|nr:TlpA family protein disulfide reductase [Candidatus Omnitrophota bacterium]